MMNAKRVSEIRSDSYGVMSFEFEGETIPLNGSGSHRKFAKQVSGAVVPNMDFIGEMLVCLRRQRTLFKHMVMQ